MTQTEKKQIEELRQDLADLKTTMDKIVMYLVDDNNSNSKGVVSRVNELEATLNTLNSQLNVWKWIVSAVSIPVLIEIVKSILSGFTKLKEYGLI